MNWITEKVNELCGNDLLETAKIHVEVHRGDILDLLVEIVPDSAVDTYVRDAMARAGEGDEITDIAVAWCKDDARDVRPFIDSLKGDLADSLESQVINEADLDHHGELAQAIMRHGTDNIDWVDLAELYLTDAEIERVVEEMIGIMVDDKFLDVTAEEGEDGK